MNYQTEPVWDKISEERINKLHPDIRTNAREFINTAEKEHGIKLRITSGYRSIEAQDELFAQGRTKPGKKITNAKGGSSYHNYGLAIDVVELKEGKALWYNDWFKIGEIGKSVGFEWGGEFNRFKDLPHFQKTFGWDIATLKSRVNRGLMEDGYVDIE